MFPNMFVSFWRIIQLTLIPCFVFLFVCFRKKKSKRYCDKTEANCLSRLMTGSMCRSSRVQKICFWQLPHSINLINKKFIRSLQPCLQTDEHSLEIFIIYFRGKKINTWKGPIMLTFSSFYLISRPSRAATHNHLDWKLCWCVFFAVPFPCNFFILRRTLSFLKSTLSLLTVICCCPTFLVSGVGIESRRQPFKIVTIHTYVMLFQTKTWVSQTHVNKTELQLRGVAMVCRCSVPSMSPNNVFLFPFCIKTLS